MFQRTPIWVTPKFDRADAAAVQRLFARVPLTQRAARRVNTSVLELIMVAGVIHYRQAKAFNRGPSGSPSGTCAARSTTPRCARS